MKLNAGIITEKLAETKTFYTKTLGFGVTFENDFYLLYTHQTMKQKSAFYFQTIPVSNLYFKPLFKIRECI